MSEQQRVLIVDDHKEIRTTLRANLEALEAPLDIVDVPSGEEAILEAVGEDIDLMIADVGLPGLSGLELLEKVKVHSPQVKIILVTGLEDEDIRRKVADAGTDAFFLKPVKIPELLRSVRRCLGLKPESMEEQDREPLPEELLGEEVDARIQDLRGELGAISIIILSQEGEVAAKSGGLPDAVYETHVLPELVETFKHVNAVTTFLNLDQPHSHWYFSGEKYDLFWTHISSEYGMLVVTNPISQNTDVTWVMTTLDLAVRETWKIIQEVKGKAKTPDLEQEPAGPEQARQEETIEPDGGHEEVEVDTTQESEDLLPDFIQVEGNVEKTEADAFWDSAALEEEGVENPDALSFEEAQKLGFIPDSKEEDD